MTLVTLPDVEALVIEYLSTHSELELLLRDLEDTNRVFPDAVEASVYPFLTVTRIGGRPRPRTSWIDRGHLQLLAWAQESRAEAWEVCALALAALHQAPQSVSSLGIITAVEDVLGPRPLPDPEDPSRPRFLAEVLVTATPDNQPGS